MRLLRLELHGSRRGIVGGLDVMRVVEVGGGVLGVVKWNVAPLSGRSAIHSSIDSWQVVSTLGHVIQSRAPR